MGQEMGIRVGLYLNLAVTAAFLFSPAAQAASPNAKQLPKTVEIGELGRAARVRLDVGDTLRIVLAANPSTGYGWTALGNDGAVLQAGKQENTPGAKQRMGAAGRQTLTFIAKAAGQDHLTLNYKRPWEKNAKPVRSYAVDVTVDSADRLDQLAVTPAGTLVGTYSGKLPCADCSGILTTVAFYAASPQQMSDTYYVRTMKYLGAPRGDTVFVSAGKWSLKKGTPANPNGVTYAIGSNTSDQSESYLLKGDTLIALGSDGKPIQAPFNMNLKKQP
jgi:predicted secreted protein